MASTTTLTEARRLLGVSDTATADEVSAAWRRLRSALHPDRGGDAAEFNAARAAYQRLNDWLNEPVACPACGGTGHKVDPRTWALSPLLCPRCHGNGAVRRG